jgi:DNA-directed RNA polymerase subunit RPC12/RpoP
LPDQERYPETDFKPRAEIVAMNFSCPNCKQELEADEGWAGKDIQCPSCGGTIAIPAAPAAEPAAHSLNPIASSAHAREAPRHFAVPMHDTPSEVLIEKPRPPLEVAKNADKTLHIKCIKRTECVEVGKDRFDEIVSDFLGKVGESNIVTINTIAYSHIDIGSQKLLTDYGVMIVYKG